MLGALVLSFALGGLVTYVLSHPQKSTFGMPLPAGKIPDVFGVGQRALRRSNKRAERKAA